MGTVDGFRVPASSGFTRDSVLQVDWGTLKTALTARSREVEVLRTPRAAELHRIPNAVDLRRSGNAVAAAMAALASGSPLKVESPEGWPGFSPRSIDDELKKDEELVDRSAALSRAWSLPREAALTLPLCHATSPAEGQHHPSPCAQVPAPGGRPPPEPCGAPGAPLEPAPLLSEDEESVFLREVSQPAPGSRRMLEAAMTAQPPPQTRPVLLGATNLAQAQVGLGRYQMKAESLAGGGAVPAKGAKEKELVDVHIECRGGDAAAVESAVADFLAQRGFEGPCAPRRRRLKTRYPLHAAVEERDPNMVRLLLGARADPAQRNSSGFTAEDLARMGDNEPVRIGCGGRSKRRLEPRDAEVTNEVLQILAGAAALPVGRQAVARRV